MLIVDDEPSIRALGTVILESNGFTVAAVADAEAAMATLAQAEADGGPVEVVVLDITLPGGPSGFEVLEAIQDRYPDLPVIACSGYFQDDARDLCKGLGFADILQKPYTPDRIVSSIRRAHLAANRSHADPLYG